jgi:CBS domain-containing protein
MNTSRVQAAVDCKVRDLMQVDVVCLDTGTSIADAVRTFEEYRISGAPVTASDGTLVGVLSAFDIARSDHVDDGGIASERTRYYLSNPLEEEITDDVFGDEEIFAKEDYSAEILGRETVGDWMNPKVISIDPDASLRSACEMMANERIHRVVVTEEDRVIGIVSSFDVVRWIAEESAGNE